VFPCQGFLKESKKYPKKTDNFLSEKRNLYHCPDDKIKRKTKGTLQSYILLFVTTLKRAPVNSKSLSSLSDSIDGCGFKVKYH
jgi:hypothetical protein